MKSPLPIAKQIPTTLNAGFFASAALEAEAEAAREDVEADADDMAVMMWN